MILFAHIIGQQFGMVFLGCEDKINSHVSTDSNFFFLLYAVLGNPSKLESKKIKYELEKTG